MNIHRLALLIILSCASSLCAGEKRHGPEAIEIKVSVGTADEEMKFVPDTLSFERGKYYKMVLHNPSSEDHYFTSDAFSTHIFTRKVEVADKDGKTVAEIHGAINDIELKPGATIEWFFYPMTKGRNLKLYCHKDGHEEQGMTGTINISGPPPFSK